MYRGTMILICMLAIMIVTKGGDEVYGCGEQMFNGFPQPVNVGEEAFYEVCEPPTTVSKFHWTFGDDRGKLETTVPYANHTWYYPGVYTVNVVDSRPNAELSYTTKSYVKECADAIVSNGPVITISGVPEVGQEMVFSLCEPDTVDEEPAANQTQMPSGSFIYQWRIADGYETDKLPYRSEE